MLLFANHWDSASPRRRATTLISMGVCLTFTSVAMGQGRPDVLWEVMGHGSGTHAVDFSPGGSWVASGSEDSHVRIWGLASGVPGPDTQNCCGVYSVDISDDQARVVSGSFSILQISRTDTGEVLHRWSSGQSFLSVCFSPDGAWLASASEGGGVKIWDSQSAGLIRTLTAGGPCRDVAFSPDGAKLATTSGAQILVWNTSDWSLAQTLTGGGSTLHALQFSRDGSRILGTYSSAKLWRVNDGNIEQTFLSTSGLVLSAALSPDGRVVVGNTSLGQIVIWDASSGSVLRMFDDQTDFLQRTRFSVTGRLFAYGQTSGNIVVARNPFWLSGDLNGDGSVNATDQSLFVEVLLGGNQNPELRICSDLNGDDTVDGHDVASFVAAITGE